MKTGKQLNIVATMALAGVLTALPLTATLAQDQPTAQQHKEATDTRQQKRSFSDGVKQGLKKGKLEAALMFSEHLSAFKIQADVEGDLAILKGEVAQSVEKELAGVIAKGIDGINKVDNQLVVGTAAERRDPETEQGLSGLVRDADITAQVKAEFVTSREIDTRSVDVTTRRGVVTLEGEVESKEAKFRAEQIALTANNVNGVKNRLRVSNS